MQTPPAHHKKPSPCITEAIVSRRDVLCAEHVELEFTLNNFPPSTPGQFLQIRCNELTNDTDRSCEWPVDGFPSLAGDELHGRQAFLRRPFSIADQWSTSDNQTRLTIISHAIGVGTRWLETLQPHTKVGVSGPLGNGFRLPTHDRPLILIGGGVGVPPLLYLAQHLHTRQHPAFTAIIGARTHQLLPLRLRSTPTNDGRPTPCVQLRDGVACNTIITTNDASLGLPGLVTDGLHAWINRHPHHAKNACVFACGPDPMLRAIADATRQLNLPCQLCIERNMGCGMGTCLSCVVRAADSCRSEGWRWALACQDGPVFERDVLLDYGPDTSA